jgi:hypothetical protein
MARIFTIDFEFQGSQHAAMVSTWEGDAKSYVIQISLYDEALQELVPDGIVRFSTTDDGVLNTNQEQAELVHCLRHVVQTHLQQLRV